jgi:hypothetical protein
MFAVTESYVYTDMYMQLIYRSSNVLFFVLVTYMFKFLVNNCLVFLSNYKFVLFYLHFISVVCYSS